MADHPLKVPPELFTEWLSEALLEHDAKSGTVAAIVADKAAQWAADQELEACCEWSIARLRAAMRPKPSGLKEQALEALDQVEADFNTGSFGDTIRRALEALPDE